MKQSDVRYRRAFSLIELLITVAVFTLVFGGLFGAVQFTIKLIGISKAKTSAVALANERIEYIRTLPYDVVGTTGGIPNGPIPQNATTTLNGILFHERVLIQYVDSPDDGTGASDSNGILADYKRIKVEYSWATQSGTSTIFLLTNVVPPGIETTAGGGTLTVNVFDALVQPVSGAAVRVYNKTTTTTIDTTQYTNAQGVAMFSGAPAASNYEIFVTKPDYSTDQTYVATTSNPNPTTLPVSVLLNTVSTMNFQIDRLSDLLVRTIEPPLVGLFSDSFDDATKIASQTDTVAAGGLLTLGGGAGAYAPLGTVFATTTAPSALTAWQIADVEAVVPINTTYSVQVYQVSSTSAYALVPDADLPGNSSGFTTASIDLSGLDVSAYPSLALGATLMTSDPNSTPSLREWGISYVVAETMIPNVPFSLRGTKIIGTDLTPSSIYKYSQSHTTDAAGEVLLPDMEWDSYDVSVDSGAYDIYESCADIPYILNPGVSDTLTLTLVPNELHSMRVSVIDTNNNPIPDAQVTLSRPGLTQNGVTSACGQIFFNSGLNANIDYEIQIQKGGYSTQTITPVEINGDETVKVVLTAL